MRTILIAMTLLAAPMAYAGGGLDGSRWAVETAEKGNSKKEKDTLTFDKGKMRSSSCDEYGFGAGSYTGGANAFEVDTVSTKEGRIHWKGAVKGDQIQGTFVWTKPGQAPIEYLFQGKRQ